MLLFLKFELRARWWTVTHVTVVLLHWM